MQPCQACRETGKMPHSTFKSSQEYQQISLPLYLLFACALKDYFFVLFFFFLVLLLKEMQTFLCLFDMQWIFKSMTQTRSLVLKPFCCKQIQEITSASVPLLFLVKDQS